MTRDQDRELELGRLRAELARRRAEWVPRVAPDARASTNPDGWRIGDISGAAGKSLLIYADPDHRTHVDFNGEAWKGDDLDLIRCVRRLRDFPSTVAHAAGLIGFPLKAWAGRDADAGAGAARRKDERREWPVIIPAPKNAGEPPPPRPRAGEHHEARHVYRDRDGAVLLSVDRFRAAGTGRKRFCPLTWRHPAGQPERGQWVPYGPTGELPLYGLDRLPGAEAVLLVEGERTADAAQEIAPPGFAVVTYMGGGGKADRADYRPLDGLPVTGWPDHDPEGAKAMVIALRRAAAAGANVRSIVAVPAEFPAKWDLADPWPESNADPATRVAELIDGAPARETADPGVSDSAADVGGLGEWDAGDDDYKVPPRGWLLGNTFCRGFLSSLLADGAVGKTSLRIVQLLSVATDRSLTGEHVFHRGRVLLVSLEDGRDELRRRVRAAMLHHSISAADLTGWLFPAAISGPHLAEMRDGVAHAAELEATLRQVIRKRRIDLVVLDPFVKTHGVGENDNAAIDFVCKLLTQIAIDLDVAVDTAHHLKKGLAEAGDANAGRGASSFKDAGRLVYTLTRMTPQEAKELGVAELERRCLVRLDNGKVNLAPPSAEARWFKLVGVPLGNATDAYPSGDTVQTVEAWTPPDPWRSITSIVANEVLDKINAGLPTGGRYSPRADAARAAWRLVQTAAPDLTEVQCQHLIKTWLGSGVLEEREYHDAAQRKDRLGLFVNATKRPGNRDG